MAEDDTRSRRAKSRHSRLKKQPLDTRPIGERAASFFHRDSHVDDPAAAQSELHRDLQEDSASTLFSD